MDVMVACKMADATMCADLYRSDLYMAFAYSLGDSDNCAGCFDWAADTKLS